MITLLCYSWKLIHWGCRHSSVDSSVPSNQPPRVRVHLRFYLFILIWVMWKRRKWTKKRPGSLIPWIEQGCSTPWSVSWPHHLRFNGRRSTTLSLQLNNDDNITWDYEHRFIAPFTVRSCFGVDNSLLYTSIPSTKAIFMSISFDLFVMIR